ncbi:MAG: amidohydrolase [Anaerolinea sp.]|nr:amidohydrolase [Anaerolinea sp.]
MVNRAEEIEADIIAWRRDFHAHPELGFQEFRTARIVAETLTELGLEVVTGVGKTGVMAVIGEGTPVIGIRADMDALPIMEANEVEYVSQSPGVMHACGHDSHTAMLLGVARILATMPDRPPGQIRLFFQPCEETTDAEGKSGAQRMVEEGALDGVDHVIALHVASDLPAGKIIANAGPLTAAVDDFNATIIGKGCHGAHPDEGIDPIYLAAQVLNALHGIRARRINPIHPAVVTIGTIHGGAARNVIPDEVTISGTLRSYDPRIREQLRDEVERALGVARALGGDYNVEFIIGCPSVLNDAHVAEVMRAVATEVIGAENIIDHEPSMGGEDFSYMTNRAPGAMFLLGAKRDSVDRPHHNPLFDLDESVFKIGTSILTETTCRLLKEKA